MKPKLAVVLGPTGVGKSEVALDLAEEIQGEILSVDSLQVYRGLDIGTAKPGREERERIRHHLIDIVEPYEAFDAARFREFALQALEGVHARGKRAILCGGTGLYFKALTQGLFVGPGRREKIRAALERESVERLHERLRQVDPDATMWIHPNDRQRTVRALEVFQLTERPISHWQQNHGFREEPFVTLKVGLYRERQELYERINRRCGEMVAAGLAEEVRGLLDGGYGAELKPLQSVGYRHMVLYLNGELEKEEALALMKRDTRRLAKRQLTWFRGDPEIRWFHPEKEREEIFRAVRNFFS